MKGIQFICDYIFPSAFCQSIFNKSYINLSDSYIPINYDEGSVAWLSICGCGPQDPGSNPGPRPFKLKVVS